MFIFLLQLLTGLAYGMLYFMITAGLTIMLGVMNVINLAHGAFYFIGAYITFVLVEAQWDFWPALLIATIVLVAVGTIVEKFLIQYVYGKELKQVLLTFGLSYILVDTAKWIWGAEMGTIAAPHIIDYSVSLGGYDFPAYRLFIVLVGCLLALLLLFFEFRTRIGAIIRAGVDDREMLSSLGINVGIVFTGVFAFGAGLAGLSGGLGAPLIGVHSGMENDILVTSLIVVVVGGLGSWRGSFVGAILIGVIETLTKAWIPSLSMFIVFMIMIVVLLIRPQGLFGKGVEM